MTAYYRTEHGEQVALFSWAGWNVEGYPELAYLYAIPNGGKRDKATAAKLQAEGVRPGVLDVHLPIARGRYIGLWLEMKVGGNKMTQEQREWLGAMVRFGHRVKVCYSADEAISALIEYLMLKGEK